MITYEQDPDVVRWGLQLFEGDPYSNCVYYEGVTPNNTDYYFTQDFKEDQYDEGCNNVEDDELIAHALQEQLSQLSVTEAPGSPTDGEEKVDAPFYQHDWVGQSMQNYSYGIEEPNIRVLLSGWLCPQFIIISVYLFVLRVGHHNGHAEENDTRPSSSCSSPGEKSNYGEEWSYLELTDEYSIDGEVGKRLNQMIPIPVSVTFYSAVPFLGLHGLLFIDSLFNHQTILIR